MKIAYAHLCDYASISREGKLSVNGIFSRISPPRLPHVHPQAYLAFGIELTYAELSMDFPVRIDFVDSDGGPLFRAEARLAVPGHAKVGERVEIAQIIGMGMIRFEKEGMYNVNIWLSERLERTLELTVVPAAMGG